MLKSTMREMLHEHNTLNGFWFCLVEFIVVALVALALSAFQIAHGHPGWAIAYLGVSINACAVCLSVIGQMRRGERSSSLAETYFGAGREKIRREHPHVARHTVAIMVVFLFPFLLAILTIVDR